MSLAPEWSKACAELGLEIQISQFLLASGHLEHDAEIHELADKFERRLAEIRKMAK